LKVKKNQDNPEAQTDQEPQETQEPQSKPSEEVVDLGSIGMPVEQVKFPRILPILPLRGTVIFPGTVTSLGVGRPASRRLLDACLPKSKIIGLVTQLDEDVDDPGTDDLFRVGVAGIVLKLIRQPDETISIIVHGLARIRIQSVIRTKPYFKARVRRVRERPGSGKKFEAGVSQMRLQARELIELTPNAEEQALTVLMNIDSPSNLADFLAANLNLDVPQKQDLLEDLDVAKRVRSVHLHLSSQLEIVKLQQKIQHDVESSIGKGQRQFFLREQLKAIQKELGEDEDSNTQLIRQLSKRLEEANPPQKVMAEAQRDLSRLELIPPASPEFSLILTYLELVADLPWRKSSQDNLDLARAKRILDRDHYGLTKVKRRLIEFLAVRKLNPNSRGAILCLVGPPGVGKTSLGQSVADAMNRQFARMSFGGIRDEAEIRGHRRTYIGAMPGRIIQEVRRAGTNNPVLMLDEVDKLGADFRGDPASALLEVLDPRQNHAFVDRYMDVPFDLSQVIFIATANYMGTVPPALADRMEVIQIPGYTDHDKLQIATRYLVPRQLKENGLTPKICKWSVTGVRKIINDYTREAGVRELERQIGGVCRGVASKVAGGSNRTKRRWTVDSKLVHTFLGPEKYVRDLDLRVTMPGVVVGLAYTPVGGEILFIEATAYAGKGEIILTGQIGQVMKESAGAAMSLFKTHADKFNLDIKDISKRDVHIHVPAGAVPKDGPSAGIAMYTAIASLFLDLPTKPKLAMTGEITLRGLVLPIGGLKGKTLAATRAGIKTVLLPQQNRGDLEEIDSQVRQKLRFVLVEHVDQVLENTLGKRQLQQAIRANGRKQRLLQEASVKKQHEQKY